MSAGGRRTQLLDAAERVFGDVGFDDVSMESIAQHAGVTRALVYHYFPTKADLFAAVWQRAHESLRATADFGDAITVRDGIIAALEAYLDFYSRHLALVVIANRSSISSTPTVRDPIDDSFKVLCTTVLDAAGAVGRGRVLAASSFAGWVAFIRETTLATLVDKHITSSENLALCILALDATVGAHVDLMVAPMQSTAARDPAD
ncbi:TetR/AcrR family transcriptional regulator [Actinomycetes bacterium M1A6_2h]